MKKETKEEVEGGILTGIFFLTVVVLLIIGWAPISHYIGKWNNLWEDSNTPTGEVIFSPETDWDRRYWKADNDCSQRAREYFGSTKNKSYASSTSALEYETYDCYGIKYTKIP